MSSVISNTDDITTAWLADVLRRNGQYEFGQILEIRPILTKTLQVSQVIRLGIKYASDSPSTAPSTLFLKLSRPQRSTSVNDRAEIEFYESIGMRSAGSLVRCYEAAFSEHTGLSHLLLEDLFETHTQPNDGELPSDNDCELAVAGIAEFHAQWWDHPDVGKSIGRVFDQAWLDTFLTDLEKSINGFLRFLGDDISTGWRRVYERLLLSSRVIWGRLTDPRGLTVTNGDLHWWNFLYPKNAAKDRVRIIDWQLWHLDLGARDLAFLIALGGFAKRRSTREPELLRMYHQTLLTNGVKNYDWEHFWNDYRFSAIRNLNIPVIFWSQGKHESTWRNAMDRAFQSFNELDCAELLTP